MPDQDAAANHCPARQRGAPEICHAISLFPAGDTRAWSLHIFPC